jgi:hypothetical protein
MVDETFQDSLASYFKFSLFSCCSIFLYLLTILIPLKAALFVSLFKCALPELGPTNVEELKKAGIARAWLAGVDQMRSNAESPLPWLGWHLPT